MTLQERNIDLNNKYNDAYHKLELVKQDYKDNLVKFIQKTFATTSEIRITEVHGHYSSEFEFDLARVAESFEISLKIGNYAHVDLYPNKDFSVSTTSYSYRKSHKESLVELLEEAGRLHNLMTAIVKDETFYEYALKEYIESVLKNECYQSATADMKKYAAELNNVKRLLNEAAQIERQSATAAMRVVGQLVVVKTATPVGTEAWKTKTHIDIGIVTQVTPQKVRIETYGAYRNKDESFADMMARGLDYITKNKEYLLTYKSGKFYKNEILLSNFEILKDY